MLNRTRPDLESLDISNSMYFHQDNEPLHFPNMKVFKFKLLRGWEEFLHEIPIRFGNLEEVEYNRKGLTNYWINVMTENKKLRKVTALVALGRDNLRRIADEMLGLEEFSMTYADDDIKFIPDIVNFLTTANQLKKASFVKLGAYACAEAARQLNDEWESTVYDESSCCFIRKNL